LPPKPRLLRKLWVSTPQKLTTGGRKSTPHFFKSMPQLLWLMLKLKLSLRTQDSWRLVRKVPSAVSMSTLRSPKKLQKLGKPSLNQSRKQLKPLPLPPRPPFNTLGMRKSSASSTSHVASTPLRTCQTSRSKLSKTETSTSKFTQSGPQSKNTASVLSENAPEHHTPSAAPKVSAGMAPSAKMTIFAAALFTLPPNAHPLFASNIKFTMIWRVFAHG